MNRQIAVAICLASFLGQWDGRCATDGNEKFEASLRNLLYGGKVNVVERVARNNPAILVDFFDNPDQQTARTAFDAFQRLQERVVKLSLDDKLAQRLVDLSVKPRGGYASTILRRMHPSAVSEEKREKILEAFKKNPADHLVLVLGVFPPTGREKEVIASLRSASADPSATLLALSRLGDKEALAQMSERLSSKHTTQERARALDDVPYIGGAAFIPVLIAMLDEPGAFECQIDECVITSGIGLPALYILERIVPNPPRDAEPYRYSENAKAWRAWWKEQKSAAP